MGTDLIPGPPPPPPPPIKDSINPEYEVHLTQSSALQEHS